MLVEGERFSVGPRFVVYAATIRKWQPPHEQSPVSDLERDEIVNDFIRFFEQNHLTFEIDTTEINQK
jgi:hypothetical protein